MKKKFTTIVSVAALALLVSSCSGKAEYDEYIDIFHPLDVSDVVSVEDDADFIDISLEMIPLTESPAIFAPLMPAASGSKVSSNEKAIIDYSNTQDGYVMIKYKTATDKQLRTLVKCPDGTTYTYVLRADTGYDVYPLSGGNGSYKIDVYEQAGDKYGLANSATVEVKLADEFTPFLRPNQYVNYTAESKTVKKAAELVKDKTNVTDKISAIYSYVIGNFTYDKELAATLKNASGYIPNVDSVFEKGKGICFDYASVTTAMLRSQNIPTKLVIGYTGEIYHAWISAYSEKDGWIENVIYFDGKSWKLMDPTFASTGNKSDEVMQYIGDGANYKAKYIY